MSTAKPVHEIRLGLIKVSIWHKNTRVGDRHDVTHCRLYKNGAVWAQSHRYGRDDLLLLCKALDQAHSWIYGQNRLEPAESQENPT